MNAPAPSTLERVLERAERALSMLLGVALAIMAIVVCYQVLGRYVIGRSPAWSEELARYLLVWITMLGSAVTLRRGGHITVTFLLDRLSPRALRVALALRDTILVMTAGVLAVWGGAYAWLNRAQESAAIEMPMTAPYAALVLAGGLIVLVVVMARLNGTPIAATEGEIW